MHFKYFINFIEGVYQDKLIPYTEQEFIFKTLSENGKDVEIELLDSKYGHDAMFIGNMQSDWFGPRIKKFVEDDVHDIIVADKYKFLTEGGL